MTGAVNSAGSSPQRDCGGDWMARWQRMARRIRVPLGFLAAALYLFELWRRAPQPAAVAWSLLLVLPGLLLRGFAAGTVKKNRQLTVSGPYAYTRNPLYLGSMLIAGGFALALLSWAVGVALALGFLAIYVPVIASEERYLGSAFPEFAEYCRRVPRLIPRLTAADLSAGGASTRAAGAGDSGDGALDALGFSFALYKKHREYNAALGAALLYLCLIVPRPQLSALFHRL
jgi:protein-S-isoprenylcysteine O-methyltransferase Ste14